MARFVKLEACPRCTENGRDRHRDNFGIYSDGGGHCFACGFHRPPQYRLKLLIKETVDDYPKTVLPSDFTKEIPAAGWQWLLQYGLSMSYWKTYCGYSAKENRVIFPIGNPTSFSIGRDFTMGERKWKVYGDKSSYVEVISRELSEKVVLVEDIVSAHKVGQVTSAIPLFGTSIHDNVIKRLIELDRPVVLWLDDDQYRMLPRKINRLMTLLPKQATYIRTVKDPKSYTEKEIQEILK